MAQGQGGEYIRTPRQFLNVSKGKLANNKDGKFIDGYVGKLIEIKYALEKYEGQQNAKWKIVMRNMTDPEGSEAQISFKADAYYALGWFRRIRQVNLGLPFLMGVYRPKDSNEKISLCYMRQGELKIEPDKDIVPDPVKISVGTKELLDWTKTLEVCTQIADELRERIRKAATAQQAVPERAEYIPPDNEPPPYESDQHF